LKSYYTGEIKAEDFKLASPQEHADLLLRQSGVSKFFDVKTGEFLGGNTAKGNPIDNIAALFGLKREDFVTHKPGEEGYEEE
jgi:hypothetical protein